MLLHAVGSLGTAFFTGWQSIFSIFFMVIIHVSSGLGVVASSFGGAAESLTVADAMSREIAEFLE